MAKWTQHDALNWHISNGDAVESWRNEDDEWVGSAPMAVGRNRSAFWVGVVPCNRESRCFRILIYGRLLDSIRVLENHIDGCNMHNGMMSCILQ